ncbi:hypothetical protein SAMN05444285_105120 [Draconibacterium orientale]|uniref:SpoIIAA-like n=1 Tax=Draconibacterium orientale TaxID=1168034 RepID=X5DNE1_9BACT|nr:hypothetical protein [Draconibacterium orientale]AHW62142.1 hypothetical protein FH5T_16020 [Draconibacterium orientale]SET06654.1 hypothetical protein SAMN05444285_105120 [Draconibacterium orientale]
MLSSSENLHIIESLGLIIVSHNNLLDQQSVERVITDLKSNPFFRKEYSILIDIRKANTGLNFAEIEDLSQFVFDHIDDTGLNKFAILASESLLNKAVQYVRSYKHSSKYQVFSALEPAMHWLKVPQDRKPQIELKLGYLSR